MISIGKRGGSQTPKKPSSSKKPKVKSPKFAPSPDQPSIKKYFKCVNSKPSEQCKLSLARKSSRKKLILDDGPALNGVESNVSGLVSLGRPGRSVPFRFSLDDDDDDVVFMGEKVFPNNVLKSREKESTQSGYTEHPVASPSKAYPSPKKYARIPADPCRSPLLDSPPGKLRNELGTTTSTTCGRSLSISPTFTKNVTRGILTGTFSAAALDPPPPPPPVTTSPSISSSKSETVASSPNEVFNCTSNTVGASPMMSKRKMDDGSSAEGVSTPVAKRRVVGGSDPQSASLSISPRKNVGSAGPCLVVLPSSETPNDFWKNLYTSIPNSALVLLYIVSIAWNVAPTTFDSETSKLINAFRRLQQSEQLLFTMLFSRKRGWIRRDKMKYDNMTQNLTNEHLKNLVTQGFLTVMTPSTGLEDILSSMEAPELKEMCKIYKLDKVSGTKKDDRIQTIINCLVKETGGGIARFVRSSKNIEFMVAEKAIEIIGVCYCLSPEAERIFTKLFMTATSLLPIDGQIYTVPERLFFIRDLMNDFNTGKKVALPLRLSSCLLFRTSAGLEKFVHAFELKLKLLTAISKKDRQEEEMALTREALDGLKVVLENKSCIEDMEHRLPHLRKFTAGSQYAYAVDKGIDVMKRAKDYKTTLAMLGVLLGQKYFLRHCRGRWYRERIVILSTRQKMPKEIYSILERGLQDCSGVAFRQLTEKAEELLKRTKLFTVEEKAKIQSLVPTTSFEVVENVISGNSEELGSNRRTYVSHGADGVTLKNVEQTAMSHYKADFPNIFHDEGSLLKELILVAYWQTIYADCEGAFLCLLQNRPLDWGGESFFVNRHDLIKTRSTQIVKEGVEALVVDYTSYALKHAKAHSLVPHQYLKLENISSFSQFLECLTLETFVKLSEYLLGNFSERRSGLPDLSMWNTTTKKCKFVEVKSVNDRLSITQKMWLEKFKEFGVEAEVCRVLDPRQIKNNKSTK